MQVCFASTSSLLSISPSSPNCLSFFVLLLSFTPSHLPPLLLFALVVLLSWCLSALGLFLSLDLHCLISVWPKQWAYCCATHKQRDTACLCVCLVTEAHQSAEGRGESLPARDWGKSEDGEMQRHATYASCPPLKSHLFVLRHSLHPQPAA